MYQIEIERAQYDQAVDMDAVRKATSNYLIDGEQPDGEAIMVSALHIGEAVERIRALGYDVDADSRPESDD